jgi:hypothetical protein
LICSSCHTLTNRLAILLKQLSQLNNLKQLIQLN